MTELVAFKVEVAFTAEGMADESAGRQFCPEPENDSRTESSCAGRYLDQ